LALIGLLVVILAVLPYVISLEGIKTRVVSQAEAALHRDVEIGHIRLQILTGLGAGLDHLRIANPPGWQRPDFVKVDTLSVKVAFWPLLQRKIEVSRIILSDGDIVIERDEKGQMNYADLTAPRPGATPPTSPPPDTSTGAPPLADFLVSRVSLRHVNVTFIDRQVVKGKSLTTMAQDVQADLTNIALNTPIDFALAASLLSDGGRNVNVYGRLGPIPATLAFDQTPLEVTLTAQDLILDPLMPYMGPEPALSAGRFGADMHIQGKLGDTLNLKGSLSLAQAVLRAAPGAGTPTTLPTVQLSQEMTINMGQAVVQLTNARLDLQPLQATLTGTVRNFTTTPQLDLHLNTNPFAPGEMLTQWPSFAAALPKPTTVQGTLQLEATIKGTPSDVRATTQVTTDSLVWQSGTLKETTPQGGMQVETAKMHATLQAHMAQPRPPEVELELRAHSLIFDQQAASASPQPPATPTEPPMTSSTTAPPLNLRGKVNIDTGRIKQVEFQQLQADLSLLNGLLKSTQAFHLYGGAYEGQLQANLAQAAPDYTLQVKLADINAGQAANDLTAVHDVLFGQLTTALQCSGQGMTWDAISTTLTGKGQIRIADLKVTTLDVMSKLALGLQAVSTLTGFTVPADLAQRSFDTLQSTFQIVEGKILSDDLKLSGPDVALAGKGFLGLDQSIKFEGTALVSGNLASAFGPRAAFLKDKEGRIAVPLAVQGSVTKPQIALNESYLTAAATKALGKQAGEHAGKELQNLLDKALPGKPADPNATQTGEPKPDSEKGQTPQQQIEKALKGLFKR
jgi:uncharacterized protein involved in outer membrane biogenesis